jgi:chromosome segregation ATPase
MSKTQAQQAATQRANGALLMTASDYAQRVAEIEDQIGGASERLDKERRAYVALQAEHTKAVVKGLDSAPTLASNLAASERGIAALKAEIARLEDQELPAAIAAADRAENRAALARAEEKHAEQLALAREIEGEAAALNAKLERLLGSDNEYARLLEKADRELREVPLIALAATFNRMLPAVISTLEPLFGFHAPRPDVASSIVSIVAARSPSTAPRRRW